MENSRSEVETILENKSAKEIITIANLTKNMLNGFFLQIMNQKNLHFTNLQLKIE